MKIWTAGHSNRDCASFIALLDDAGVRLAVDVRSYPGSRRHPWFNKEKLEPALADHGIAYLWLKALGGRRKPRPGPSPHAALEGSGFKDYVDWMDSPPYQEGLSRLLEEASGRPTAVFCAEKDPAHCHRRYLSDLLAVKGLTVVHLIEKGVHEAHTLHPDLVLEEGKPVYRGRQGRLY